MTGDLNRLAFIVHEWATSLPEGFALYENNGQYIFQTKDSDFAACFIVYANLLRQSALLHLGATEEQVQIVLDNTLATFKAEMCQSK